MGKDLARGAGEGQEAEQGEAQNKGGDKSSQHVILRPGCRQAGGGGNVVPREGGEGRWFQVRSLSGSSKKSPQGPGLMPWEEGP